MKSLSSLDEFGRRSDVRLAAFGLAAVAAVYLGFIAISVKTAERLVRGGGYFLMFATFTVFLHALRQVWRARPATQPMTMSQRWLAGGAIALLSVMAFYAEPYRGKILNDEYVLQSTAFNFHHYREAGTMVRAYEIDGIFVSTDNFLDKRPYFYPFLVSLLHDFTGYRPANAFILNTLLYPLALGLIFAFGRQLAGWKGGMLATLLLGGLPLLGQNATGAGMELLNVVMILAALLLATHLLRAPDEDRLAAFLLAVVLLAQSRYESVLYVLGGALVVFIVWIRSGRICLPWRAVLVPLLLVPVALQSKVVSNTPVLWELGEKTSRFSAEYVADNFRGVFGFLFNGNAERANSLLLSALGLAALVAALGLALRHLFRRQAGSPTGVALGCFSVVIVANTVLVLFYYWANFDDPMASRFSLPLHLLMAFTVVVVAAALDRRMPAMRVLVLAAGFWGVVSSAGKFGLHYYSNLGFEEAEWQRRYVNALPPASRLIVSNRSPLPWLLQKTSAIQVGRARVVAERLQYQLEHPTFHEILVFQSLRPTTAEGNHQIAASEQLPPNFKLELLAEKRFDMRLSRISRLVAIELPSKEPETIPPREAPAAGRGE